MDKEMEFKNKSIKEKVNGSFEMIIVLYVVSVAFAVFLMFAVKIVPSATEYFVLAGGIADTLYCRTGQGTKQCGRKNLWWRT